MKALIGSVTALLLLTPLFVLPGFAQTAAVAVGAAPAVVAAPPAVAAAAPAATPTVEIMPGGHLILGSLHATGSDQYSNFVGLQNDTGSITLLDNTTNTFSFTFGYQKKPILRDLLDALSHDGYKAQNDGSFWDDFLFSAVTVSATAGWTNGFSVSGQQLKTTQSTRPTYAVSVQYDLPIETIAAHLLHGSETGDYGISSSKMPYAISDTPPLVR